MTKCAVLLAAGLVLAAALQSASADEPASVLEGRWTVVAVTMNGVKATDRIAGGLMVTVRGNKLMLKPGLAVDGNGKVEPGDAAGTEATFTLDLKKSPAHIDLTFGAGRDKAVLKGIYVLDKGELRICFHNKVRPVNFANVAESGETLLVARREKP